MDWNAGCDLGGDGGGGGLKICIGRITDCTTWGLSALVESGSMAMPSSAEECRLRSSLKMTNTAANNAPKTTSLPVLVLKKLRKSRGFMAVWMNGWVGRAH